MPLLGEKKSPIDGVPVVPGGTIWGGHLHILANEPDDFEQALRKWSTDHACPVTGRCTFWMGPATPSLSVTRTSDVQYLLKKAANRSVFPLMEYHVKQLFGSNNVGVLNGKQWKQQRRVIMKTLSNSLAPSTGVNNPFRTATNQLINMMQTEFEKTDDNVWKCENLLELMKSLTMDCFGHAAFTTNFETCQHYFMMNDTSAENGQVHHSQTKIGPALDWLTSDLMRRVTTDLIYPTSHNYSWPNRTNLEFQSQKELVLSFLRDLVSQRRNEKKEKDARIPQDLLTGYMNQFDRSKMSNKEQEEEEGSSDNIECQSTNDVAQSLLGLLFAGYETTSVTLTYCLYLLAKHPHVLSNCRDEIRIIENDTCESEEAPSERPQQRYSYLEAVIKETLRLYPPAISTTRACDRDIDLPSGQEGEGDTSRSTTTRVPKGTYLYFPLWLIQRDSNHFHNPLQFNPERWVVLGGEDDNGSSSSRTWRTKNAEDQNTSSQNDSNQAFVAFSAGARSCPGEKFSMKEMTAILLTLLPKVDFEISAPGYTLEPHRNGFVQCPKQPIPMAFRLRED